MLSLENGFLSHHLVTSTDCLKTKLEYYSQYDNEMDFF